MSNAIISGKSLLGYKGASGGKDFFLAENTVENRFFPEQFLAATKQDVNLAASLAEDAFQKMKKLTRDEKLTFLNTLIEKLSSVRKHITERACMETSLPAARIDFEFERTLKQIKLAIQVLEDGTWTEATLDVNKETGLNIRKMRIPLGPVAVFGAVNFPLAYSVAGGDTISAFAAGCPVIVKAHNGHLGTSELVAQAILAAGNACGMPDGFFSLLFDKGYEVGIELVKHPKIKAVGFTGSFHGGTALIAAANSRPDPIPVFAEMGSINPVIITEKAIAQRAAKIAKDFAASITQGCGQFCTKPGLFLLPEEKHSAAFIELLKQEMVPIKLHGMLNKQIEKNFTGNVSKNIHPVKGVNYISFGDVASSHALAIVSAETFIENISLQQEFFGPLAILIICKNNSERESILKLLGGQLTTTLICEEGETEEALSILNTAQENAGRIIINGVPTGVEVCNAMNHGGPYPASSNAHFTAVGADAIKRFSRPLCFQNWPQELLPVELKDSNPLNIFRKQNNLLTQSPL